MQPCIEIICMAVFFLLHHIIWYFYLLNTFVVVSDSSNKHFQLAETFIQATNHTVFLTGKAGTGKTTFLKHIKATIHKQLAVLAPTGVAAINAGGVTIHSFFQLPFAPFLPISQHAEGEGFYTKHSLLARMRINSERRKLWQQLELLVIDEISMVRCDVLDAIDTILKSFRQRPNEPFGGVQLLLIGDLYQLPPVVQEEEWKMLQNHYKSPYFFDSHVVQQQPPVYIELEKIYRQQDAQFIKLLNEIRENTISSVSQNLLISRYNPATITQQFTGYITLTTHNNQADALNASALTALSGIGYQFKATVEGDFPEKMYPAEYTLELKVGAQVMFIKNDLEKVKRYYNGKIGVITKLDDATIIVNCQNGTEEITVEREKWRNIKYTLNTATQQVEEEELGTFSQFPLRLAWAITIHKSQGLTFEKAIIDAGRAFAPGQVYVALSRCTNLGGLILNSKIPSSAINTDARIVKYVAHAKNNQQLKHLLHEAQLIYQTNVLKALFSFQKEMTAIEELHNFINEVAASFKDGAIDFVINMHEELNVLKEVGEKFGYQIQQLSLSTNLPENNESLQNRVVAGVNYFKQQLTQLLQKIVASPVRSDSKQQSIRFLELITDVYQLLYEKWFLLNACAYGYQPNIFQEEKNKLVIPPLHLQIYSKNVVALSNDVPHHDLYKQLQTLRNHLADKEKLPIYLVAGTKTLEELVMYLPNNLQELAQISGFGKVKIEQYGEAFLEVINRYCQQHGLSSSIEQKQHPKKSNLTKTNPSVHVTKEASSEVSLQLFKELKSVELVAENRNITVGTVESHLIKHISTGDLAIADFLDEALVNTLMNKINEIGQVGLATLKNALDADYSYTQIKAVLAHFAYTQQLSVNK